MKKLNQNNLDVYLFVKEYMKENEICPSYREIQQNTNYKSLTTVREVIEKLVELKLLKVNRNQDGNIITRSIRVIEDENAKKVIEELRKTYE